MKITLFKIIILYIILACSFLYTVKDYTHKTQRDIKDSLQIELLKTQLNGNKLPK